MRILIAGATGAIGTQLVPRLTEAGHEVFAMIRKTSDEAKVAGLGAVPVIADALNGAEVEAAVRQAAPDVIVHQLTAIGPIDTRHFERSFAATNRLRTEGTDNLLAAARAAGVRRFVAQSNGAFTYARTGGPVKDERDPLDSSPVREMGAMIGAIEHLESAVLAASWTEGIVLRYGAFYGPGTSMAPGSEQFEMIRKRKFPVVGDGGECGRSSTSPTQQKPPSQRSITATVASTTSSTTTLPRSPSGCRSWQRCWVPRSRCAYRGSSAGWPPARRASCS